MQTNEMRLIKFTTSAKAELAKMLEDIPSDSVFILSDSNTERFASRLFPEEMRGKGALPPLKPGEQSKTPEMAAALWEELRRRGARRTSILVNVGGGVVSDLGGFVAATYKRGMYFLNVPTTLLAQVDASVGGKTGINLGPVKNAVGLFAQPEAIVVSPEFLPYLPERELYSGLAEMLKHALLDSRDHLRRVLTSDLRAVDSPAFLDLIRDSVKVKAKLVSYDPGDWADRRALNLGHTVGHAVEGLSLQTPSPLLHGEAVAWGLVAELWMSVREKGFPLAVYEEVRDFVRRHYPSCPMEAQADRLLELMAEDKKNDEPGLNFTLLEDVGKYTIDNYCSPALVREALRIN